ncbi:MAG: HAMP domain-containing protein [Oscillospiraceae bacterium]|nr:HAMP domain-containing protein [Oscillospiraceae bacterium]
MQFKIGLSYILVIAAVLVLLNTYPLIVSEDLLFQSKVETLQSAAVVMSSSLSELEELSEETAAQVETVMSRNEQTGFSRVLVTDAAGRVLYDTREIGSAVGSYALMTEVVEALRGNDAAHSAYENGTLYTRAASPVLFQNRIIGSVFVYEFDKEQAEILGGFRDNLLRLSVGIALIVLIVSLALSGALTRRISELLEAIRSVREGAYSHRAEVKGGDEIAQIAVEFNSMTDRLQRTEAARKRFVSDASHELKTPLAAIRLLTDSILQNRGMEEETVHEFISDIGQEAERLSRITEDLLRLTRLDSDILAAAEQVDLEQMVRRVIRTMEILAEEKQIELSYQAETGCVVLAAPDEIHQVIYNLVDNAIKYSRSGCFVQVELRRENGCAVLSVSDNGIGIPEGDLDHIFERFYRVDKARSRSAGGTGLGLSIVRDFVEKRGGTVTAACRAGGGSVFTVRLPLVEGGAAV